MPFKTIGLEDEKYPYLLKEIPDPPKQIYIRGPLPDYQLPAVAMVGTRKATKAGIQIAEKIATDLAKHSLVIVSGLAMGIDTAAHRGALSAGGRTVAVLGNGIDEVYPAQNEKLAKEILEAGGAIISEYPPGEPSFRSNFIHRNRIISGLSVAVIIIEAPVKSGALATAGFAALQGRNVFVIPGQVSHPNYIGSHALIRDGAILATKASDILEDLGIQQELGGKELGARNGVSELRLEGNEDLIRQVLRDAGKPLEVDRIAALANLEPQLINQALTGLMLKGLIRESSGKYEINNS